jgi:hypothetical protein
LKKNGFTLTTEPIEKWLRGCGCKDLQKYYNASSETKKGILDRLYHEYKRLNLSDTRILYFFSIMEQTQFRKDKDINKELEEIQTNGKICIDPLDLLSQHRD